MDVLLLAAAFFTVAVLYAAAGFGGGSSYLALLALFGLPPGTIRPIALICNLAVTSGASLTFARAGVTPWRKALPLVIASVPAAFLGGRVQLPREQYLLVLGLLLIAAAGLMLFQRRRKSVPEHSVSGSRAGHAGAMLVGGAVGFVSGVVGIGGGIFLSPLLFLTRWATARQIAATTSLFIVLNSLAGLIGQLSVGISVEAKLTTVLVVAVLVGGIIGTRMTLRQLSPLTIQILAAGLILLVGLRLVYSNWTVLLSL